MRPDPCLPETPTEPPTQAPLCPRPQALTLTRRAGALAVAVAVAACGDTALLTVEQGSGLRPTLPAPVDTWLPTVHIAPARPWAEGEAPQAAPGLTVNAFARGLDHPRWLFALPNGDVLVAETNAPARPDNGVPGWWGRLRGWVMGRVMARAGAATPSADRITWLRDTDGDGVADRRGVLLEGLHSPFGMALVGEALYVADTDAVLRFPYRAGDTRIGVPGVRLAELPAGPINHHWTKNLLASGNGRTLYVSVGSNSNVGERGLAAEAERAAIWAVDLATGAHRVFASGLRNPNGMVWSDRGEIWTVVNERDEIGSDLVPDYLSSVREGDFFGWPHSWYGGHVDVRVQPPAPDLVARARVPDYALGPHTASLGLAAARPGPPAPGRPAWPAAYANGLFVGQHGSWNRRPRSGYQVVFVAFAAGRPVDALPRPVLGGFLNADGEARGRPVGLAWDRTGGLLVADDVGDTVWRVAPAR